MELREKNRIILLPLIKTGIQRTVAISEFSSHSINQIIKKVAIPNWPSFLQNLLCSICMPFIFLGCFLNRQKVFYLHEKKSMKLIACLSANKKGQIGNLVVIDSWLLFRLLNSNIEEFRQEMLQQAKTYGYNQLYALIKKNSPLSRLMGSLGFIIIDRKENLSLLSNNREYLSLLFILLMYNVTQIWHLQIEKNTSVKMRTF